MWLPAQAAQLLVVLVGIPGSGKSTVAQALIDQAPAERPWQRVSQDVLGSRGRCISVAQRALQEGKHVLIDRCNFDEAQRAHWLGLSGPHTHRLAIFLDVPHEEACRRVLERSSHEGGVDAESMSRTKLRSIVGFMQESLSPPRLEEGFEEVLMAGEREDTRRALAHVQALAVEMPPPERRERDRG